MKLRTLRELLYQGSLFEIEDFAETPLSGEPFFEIEGFAGTPFAMGTFLKWHYARNSFILEGKRAGVAFYRTELWILT